MSLSNKQISSILHMITDTTHRMIDAIDNNNDLSTSDLRAMRNTMMKKMCDVSLDDFMAHRRANHRLLIKRGTDSENNAYIGKNGEITVDTDKKTLRVHDGETTGGIALAKYDELPNPQDIILATIPDYTNGTECVFLSETTAPENGYFEVTGTAFNDTYLNIKINGIPKKIATSTNNTFSTTGFVLFPVKQGDKIQGISSHNNTGKITFYPMCK